MLYSLAITGILIGCIVTSINLRPSICRCHPTNECWPSETYWSNFNASINGSLIRLQPVASVCHQPTFNQSACDELQSLSRDTGWRASQPGALQNWVWEVGSNANETCFVESPKDAPCHQGNIASYSVAVESEEEIKVAVRFAKRHNLHLVIRNTGHDLAGRSTSPYSLQIHTHRLQHIEFHEEFRLTASAQSLGSAVTIGAGVLMGELYSRTAARGKIVVGGDCPTVGVAGGYLQGGGVSDFLSHEHGLAVDNVLEFGIVTSKGELTVANAMENPDLFWALKGGGGGSFGVVTRATMRTFPDIPAVVSELAVPFIETKTSIWVNTLRILLATLQDMNHHGFGGQLLVSAGEGGRAKALLKVWFLNETDIGGAETLMEPFSTTLTQTGTPNSLVFQSLKSLTSSYRQVPDISTGHEGLVAGSVVLSNELFNSTQGPGHISTALAELAMDPGEFYFTSNLGGRVLDKNNSDDTAMHAGWRASAQLVSYVQPVPLFFEAKGLALDRLRDEIMPRLYSIDPNFSLSYRNVGDPNEKNFQQVYWGSKYRRLSRVKNKWDPEDIFISKLGVGSERWDEKGLCRKPRQFVNHLRHWLHRLYM